jgi:hypothetical protein
MTRRELRFQAIERFMKSQPERELIAGRERDRQLIEEAEEAARLTRWRRRQLERISKAS